MFRPIVALAIAALSATAGAGPSSEAFASRSMQVHVDPARAEIGRRLFQDKRLSANGTVSCASCHDVTRSGADARAFSLGFDGRPTIYNTPSVFNAALNFRLFWDGRADSLEAQVGMVIENPVEMGSRWDDVVAKVAADGWYRAAFAKAFTGGITRASIESAIADYQRTLVTQSSRFDAYLKGDANALTEQEKSGYARFRQFGCSACHQGVNLGGNMFQKFGVMGNYFADRGGETPADLGRFRVTGKESDRYVFKVPSLRNVEHTAPYFHDGSAGTLEQAVVVMFKYQLGRAASPDDVRAIVGFLRSLSSRPQQRSP
jgi:cytochrome c peroxidase